MRRWVNQLKAERGGTTPTARALTPEQQQIQALEKRVKQLELEKKHFKKGYSSLDVGRDGTVTLIESLREQEAEIDELKKVA